jgi:hypothetical protein
VTDRSAGPGVLLSRQGTLERAGAWT